MKRKAFIFPGQGAQYVGMGQDFAKNFKTACYVFEEANDILGRNLSKIIFEGPEATLTETQNSQVAIYVNSMAILAVIQEQHKGFKPKMTAGLSLGEYTALSATNRLSFQDGVKIVQKRGSLMSDACNKTQGTMAVVLGLSAEDVEATVAKVNLPNDLWAANFNCPGQVVISGTIKGIKAGSDALLAKGAKRVLPLVVHGAFHSGLMKDAEAKLAEFINELKFGKSEAKIAMNVPANFVSSAKEIKNNLIKQVTHPVRWQQCIEAMRDDGADLFVEIGCGTALAGFNKRIEGTAPTISIGKVADLELLDKHL